MINYREQARQHIRESFGDEFSIVEDSIVDSDRFFCFTFQSKEFLRTESPSAMAVGQGYTVINKEDSRFFDFGSRYALKEVLKIIAENLIVEKRIRRYKPRFELATRYDVQINAINNLPVLIQKLIAFGVTYTIPEVVGDSIFRIPKMYNAKLLEKNLTDLPVIFHGVANGLSLIDELLTSACCDFDLLNHHEKNFEKYVDKATEADLKPIW